jgi:hypothetical protein
VNQSFHSRICSSVFAAILFAPLQSFLKREVYNTKLMGFRLCPKMNNRKHNVLLNLILYAEKLKKASEVFIENPQLLFKWVKDPAED